MGAAVTTSRCGVSSLTCGVVSEPAANGARSSQQDVGSRRARRPARRARRDGRAARRSCRARASARVPDACLEVEPPAARRAGWRRPPPTPSRSMWTSARSGRGVVAWTATAEQQFGQRLRPRGRPCDRRAQQDEDAHQYDAAGYGRSDGPSWRDHREAWRTDQGGHARMQSSRRRVLIAALVLLIVAQGAWIAYPHVRNVLFPPEATSAARGHAGWRSRSAASPATGRAAGAACTTPGARRARFRRSPSRRR